MMVRRHGQGYNFVGDLETGLTLRWGAEVGQDPERAPWPELADISVGNRCERGCAACYRDSQPDGPLMSFEQYAFVLQRLRSPRWGNVFQVALGGGEPLANPEFARMVRHTRECGVAVNFTTSGLGLDAALARELAPHVGAVAVSAMSLEGLDRRAVDIMGAAGCRVNVHYVLGDSSLDEATDIVLGRRDELLGGVNAVIFLTLKPMGRAGREECLRDGPRLSRFLSAVNAPACRPRIGFDACFVPLLMRRTAVNQECVDTCEGGFFSLFIDETLRAKPCSFASDERYSFDLEARDMDFVWNSGLAAYRDEVEQRECGEPCALASHCRGTCPYHPDIVPCPGRELDGPGGPAMC